MAKLFTGVQIKRGRRSRLPKTGLAGSLYLTTDEEIVYTPIDGKMVNILDNNLHCIDGGDIKDDDGIIIETYDNGTF